MFQTIAHYRHKHKDKAYIIYGRTEKAEIKEPTIPLGACGWGTCHFCDKEMLIYMSTSVTDEGCVTCRTCRVNLEDR